MLEFTLGFIIGVQVGLVIAGILIIISKGEDKNEKR